MKYKFLRHPQWCVWVASALLLTACTKDESKPADINAHNGIAAVVNNNFSLSLFNYALGVTAYSDTLARTGSYTVLGPSNDAFKTAGYATGGAIITAGSVMNALVPYHVLHGQIRLDSLPMAFNKPFYSAGGKVLFITRWANARDTAVVVNGARVSTRDRAASNGLINVIDAVLVPSAYTDVQEAVSGDPDLSFFNAAIIRSGVAATLQTAGPYTVFAPVNAAFNAIGIASVDSVYKMDPTKLEKLVKGHIAAEMNFVYDYILKADVNANTYTQQMLGGTATIVTLIPNSTQPGRFSGINIQQSGLTAKATLSKSNVLAGNGVVHNISQVLTQ
ncbi:fasciclin domain-containing protein [Chitinophaga sp. 30R24]|uniref:fasciclin domain-containing protein n=1 Tax=Chitinophaga sp. 30R24 TaxID=3248838 RepID=UPI003B9096A5